LPQKEILQSKDNEGENSDYLFPEIDDDAFEETMDFAIAEIMEKYRSANDDESIEKAVSTEDIASAKSRGLVPQSGNWEKPKRWVRPEDADVPVDEGKKPRKPASEDLIISPETKAGIKGVFGDDFEISDFQDMYSIGLDGYTTNILTLRGRVVRVPHGTGTEDFSQFNIEVQIHDEDGREAGRMNRTFSRDENGRLKVYHNRFVIKNRYHGKGIASDINEHVEEQYEKLGVHEITLNANATVGGYAWARQGYDFATENELEEMQDMFSFNIEHASLPNQGGRIFENQEELIDQVHNFEHSWQFASWNPTDEPHGEHFGKTWMLGTSWDAKKKLDKKSQGYQRGKIYFALKRKHNEQG